MYKYLDIYYRTESTKCLMLFVIMLLYLHGYSNQMNDAPNILWIVSEDNSPLIGAYGDVNATTPNIDQLAKSGILYENAFSNNPACAPTRSTLIAGVYATSMGTHNHRSKRYPFPAKIRFFPEYLKRAGYYTTNNSKTDYNTSSENEENINLAWDESGLNAHYRNRKKNQPFFAVFNIGITHASSLFHRQNKLRHDKDKIQLPPYLPELAEMKWDAAQYYDKMEFMDEKVGVILTELERSGQADNTIIFYYSDHGGALGRSKGYLYDSGLRIPLIIKFPKKYSHLAPERPGSKVNRMVSVVDFAPSILNLLKIEIPPYMEGAPFLGTEISHQKHFIYSFKDRMDERYDMSRGVRSKKFFYRRNYMPQRRYGQYTQYIWQSSSVRAWENAYKKDKLNSIQSVFWESKPMEELYSINDDPHNIYNLADNPKYAKQLEEMRSAHLNWQIENVDIGFIPEPMIEEIAKETPLYDYVRSGRHRLKEKIPIIHKMYDGDLNLIRESLKSDDPILRYWAIIASSAQGTGATEFREVYNKLTDDSEIAIRIAASEALYRCDHSTDKSIMTLIDALEEGNTSSSLYAMDVMEIMGKDALPALPSVKKLLLYDKGKTSVYEIRAAGIRLIEKLSGYADSPW